MYMIAVMCLVTKTIYLLHLGIRACILCVGYRLPTLLKSHIMYVRVDKAPILLNW